jgi:hypothetical protein
VLVFLPLTPRVETMAEFYFAGDQLMANPKLTVATLRTTLVQPAEVQSGK